MLLVTLNVCRIHDWLLSVHPKRIVTLQSHRSDSPSAGHFKMTHFKLSFVSVLCWFCELPHTIAPYTAKHKTFIPTGNKAFKVYESALLPDKPLEGSGSLSDWMGRAGDLSREAAPVCSHAQLSTHSKERSARGTSIPNLRLVSPQSIPRKLPIARTL